MLKKLLQFTLLAVASIVRSADDPSLIPASGLDGAGTSERYRFIADFDSDGDDDLLLSLPLYTFGNSGSFFTLYLREEESLAEIGTITAHPKAVSIEKLWRKTRIWVYLRGSSSSGVIGYYVLENGKLSELNSIEINPGDGGTPIGNSITGVVFSDRLIAERSTTKDGVVKWSEWK